MKPVGVGRARAFRKSAQNPLSVCALVRVETVTEGHAIALKKLEIKNVIMKHFIWLSRE